jgi:KTSC domain
MPLETFALNSSAIASASYDSDTEELDVTFVNGRTYTHPGVPAGVVKALRDAPSAGSFYSSVIKGVYV